MHHSSNDIPVQWVKNFLHAMAEIQTSLDLEFCINKATKMVYSTDHFGGVSFTFFFCLAVAEQVPARAERARYFVVICVFLGLFMSISCLAIGDGFLLFLLASENTNEVSLVVDF
jgi:hypothetical protein